MEAGRDADGATNQRTAVSASAANADTQSQNGVQDASSDVPNKDHVPSKKATTPEGVTNLAFTIDFGEESKHGMEGRSLGDMMPPRMRKSLRDRKEKQLEKSSASSSQSSAVKEKSTPEKHKLLADKSKPKSTDKVSVSTHAILHINHARYKTYIEQLQRVSHGKCLALSLANFLYV